MKEKKLKAFTLIELLVAMVISGIVIGIAYSGYLIFSNQFQAYKKTNDKNLQGLTLNGLLKGDFLNSGAIKRSDENSMEAQYDDKSIFYQWGGSYVLRSSGETTDRSEERRVGKECRL